MPSFFALIVVDDCQGLTLRDCRLNRHRLHALIHFSVGRHGYLNSDPSLDLKSWPVVYTRIFIYVCDPAVRLSCPSSAKVLYILLIQRSFDMLATSEKQAEDYRQR